MVVNQWLCDCRCVAERKDSEDSGQRLYVRFPKGSCLGSKRIGAKLGVGDVEEPYLGQLLSC